jgi:predicted nucleic acid-binding protein
MTLLDVNVLIALAWPNHVHHDLAQTWFERNRRHGVWPRWTQVFAASCPRPGRPRRRLPS